MKRFYKIFMATLLLTLSMSITAFAGTWKQEARGWWWQNDDGSYPQSAWQWIDGNGDGIAESYYFDEDGYLLTGTTAPGGYTVDSNGAWVKDGVVQQQQAGSTEEALRLYIEASKKNNQLSSMAATSDITMNMHMEGQNLPVTMYMDMKFKDLNTSSMKYLAETKIDLYGINANSTIFYTDGYYYMALGDQKTKVAMDLGTMTKEINNSLNLSGDEVLAKALRNLTLRTDANGNRVITYTMDVNNVSSYIDSIYSMAGLSSVDTVNIKSIEGTTVINPDGYSISDDMKFSMDMSVSDVTASIDMNVHVDCINIGQQIDFTLPSTEGYVETAAAGN